ncbi:MAG: PepSY domain-containing protein [Hyphomicrobium sp.]
MRKTIMATVAALLTIATPALASDDDSCTKAPKEQWLTTGQLSSKLTERGYTVSKIEIEDGCAEAKVESKDGKTSELYLDPATGDVVKKDD